VASEQLSHSPAGAAIAPAPGDVVIKPFIDLSTFQQHFRVETWRTHALLDGPFDTIRSAMDAAFEFGATARLVVWLDYSDDPELHDLDEVPLYCCDKVDSDQAVA
jgi:hypothetical protein